jgi:hypothetical protein
MRPVLAAACLAAALLTAPASVLAQATPATDAAAVRQEIDQLRKEFESLKASYDARLTALEGKLGVAAPLTPPTARATPSVTMPAVPDVVAQPAGTTPASASNVFNPSTAVVGNFVGAAGSNTVSPAPALEMRESEVSFQAVVDPYARADFFMAFGEEGVELEEGFITFPTLPGGLLLKAGKMRAAFGKVNTLHSHVLPWVDRPLVTENLLGGDEGLNDAGLSVARLIPVPGVFLEATGQVFRGDSDDVFMSHKPGDLSYVGRLRGYHDLTESTNIELGVSYAHGRNDSPQVDVSRFNTDLYGLDTTLRWKPLRRAIYNSFLGRGELVWSRRNQPDGLQKALGWFVSGDYQLARRWFAGGRLDGSDRADDAAATDSSQSLLVTYKPTEFSVVRGQYRRTKYAFGETANEFLFQFLFVIGAHGAHPF